MPLRERSVSPSPISVEPSTKPPRARDSLPGTTRGGPRGVAEVSMGAGLGALLDQPIARGLVGLFVGAVTGFVVVYPLYRDI